MTRISLNRRDFMKLSALGTIGWKVFSAETADAYSFDNLLMSLARFAVAVDSIYMAAQINEYLKYAQNRDFRQRVLETNDYLSARGFTDLSRSVVRSNNNKIYYPIVYESCSCLNFAAPFFKIDCGCTPVTHIEGGHMAGLAIAAERLQKDSGSKSYARKVLFPKSGISLAQGDRLRGYKTELKYKSDLATVYAHYEPKTPTTGSVIVEAESDTNGKLLIGKKWDVRYS